MFHPFATSPENFILLFNKKTGRSQVAREEKWVADCELNALKRDLKHAMSRVEQLQDIEDERSRLELELTNGNIHGESDENMQLSFRRR